MSYNSTINTAEKYFEAISGIIVGLYWQDPTGKVDPNSLNSFLLMRNITVTQIGLKAHVWATEQLNFAIERWFKGAWATAPNQNDILAFYKNINIDEYLSYARYHTLVASLDRWTERELFYIREGDENSAVFCGHKCELTAMSIARGIPVNELEQDSEIYKKLVERLGAYNPQFLDPQGLAQWVVKY